MYHKEHNNCCMVWKHAHKFPSAPHYYYNIVLKFILLTVFLSQTIILRYCKNYRFISTLKFQLNSIFVLHQLVHNTYPFLFLIR